MNHVSYSGSGIMATERLFIIHFRLLDTSLPSMAKINL